MSEKPSSVTRERISAFLVLDPSMARRAILSAMKKTKSHRRDAASLLGCGRATFARWIRILGMEVELAELEEAARAAGKHHGRVGGRPRGPAARKA